jgi:hypothetical protein
MGGQHLSVHGVDARRVLARRVAELELEEEEEEEEQGRSVVKLFSSWGWMCVLCSRHNAQPATV